MAEPAKDKTPASRPGPGPEPAPAPKAAPKPAPKSVSKAPQASSSKLDFSTVAGIGMAVGGIVGGLLLENGSIQDVMQGTAAMIVFGGTLGAVLITNPISVVQRAIGGLVHVFFEKTHNATAVIEALIQFSAKARKNGIVSLEQDAAALQEPFFRKALNLAVDGTDLQELRKMMEIDILLSEQAAEAEARVWESAGGYAPTIGIIGAVMGLIQVMKQLDDMGQVGRGVAVAFVATLYGVGLANLLLLPTATRVRSLARQETLRCELIHEGVRAIVSGLHPYLIRMRLENFLDDPLPREETGQRQSSEAASAGPRKAA